MVDIHSHILPGLDDGPGSLDECIEMLQVAAGAGTTDIVATPHADYQYRYHPGLVRKLIDELQAAAGAPIRIHQGCDFHIMPDNIEDAVLHPDRYTVNGLRYLLVELDEEFHYPTTREAFERLENLGLCLIVTHPERNPVLRHDRERVEEWVSQGRLMQITAQSILGRFGPSVARFTKRLLDDGLAHIVASDAHDPFDRKPDLTHARAWIDENHSPALGELLFEAHPRAVIEGRKIDLSSFPPPRRSWWSRILGRN